MTERVLWSEIIGRYSEIRGASVEFSKKIAVSGYCLVDAGRTSTAISVRSSRWIFSGIRLKWINWWNIGKLKMCKSGESMYVLRWKAWRSTVAVWVRVLCRWQLGCAENAGVFESLSFSLQSLSVVLCLNHALCSSLCALSLALHNNINVVYRPVGFRFFGYADSSHFVCLLSFM